MKFSSFSSEFSILRYLIFPQGRSLLTAENRYEDSIFFIYFKHQKQRPRRGSSSSIAGRAEVLPTAVPNFVFREVAQLVRSQGRWRSTGWRGYLPKDKMKTSCVPRKYFHAGSISNNTKCTYSIPGRSPPPKPMDYHIIYFYTCSCWGFKWIDNSPRASKNVEQKQLQRCVDY